MHQYRIVAVLLALASALIVFIVSTDDPVKQGVFGALAGLLSSGAVRLATPQSFREYWIKRVSLAAAFGLAISLIYSKSLIGEISSEVWYWLFGQKIELVRASDFISMVALLFMLAVIVIVNRRWSSDLIVPRRRTILDAEDNKNDRDQLLEDLSFYLRKLDDSLNWNQEHFVEIEADIDLITRGQRRRSIGNLLQGIKSIPSSLFVVLGDPGAGKSVALRKLSRQMLNEARRGGTIPVYINLREWHAVDKAAGMELSEALDQFVYRYLQRQVGPVSCEFLKKHYRSLQAEGQFFYIFDSFDEVPSILDASEASDAIRNTGYALFTFMNGKRQCGLVASRYFRRPDFPPADHCVLELRPFDDGRIAELVKNQTDLPETAEVLLKKIIHESAFLGSIARSPFLLSLILDYAKHKGVHIPENQADLFKSYIDQVFSNVVEKLADDSISMSHLDQLCSRIAVYMFEERNFGLDVPLEAVRGLGVSYIAIVHALREERFFRISDSDRVSFAHRRFQEYFLIQTYADSPANIPLDAIVTDSRWRDSMVLYGEIAPFPGAANEIAECCWQAIDAAKLGSGQHSVLEVYRRGINALRYFVEAFRARPEVAADYEPQLYAMLSDIKEQLDLSSLTEKYSLRSIEAFEDRDPIETFEDRDPLDLLSARYALEAIIFLSGRRVGKVLASCIQSKSHLLTETVFRGCRYLANLPPAALEALDGYLNGFTGREFSVRRSELEVALSFHSQFEQLRQTAIRLHRQRLIATTLYWAILILATPIWLVALSIPLIGAAKAAFFLDRDAVSQRMDVLRRGDSIDLFFRGITTLSDSFAFSMIPLTILTIVWVDTVPRVASIGEPSISVLTSWLSSIFILLFVGFVSSRTRKRRRRRSLRHWLRQVLRWCWRPNFQFSALIWEAGEKFLGLLLIVLMFVMFSEFPITFYACVGLATAYLIFGFLVAVFNYLRNFGRLARDLLQDRSTYRNSTVTYPLERRVIADAFSRLRTKRYREKYVAWLENHRLSRSDKAKLSAPGNVWPGHRPNVGNDEASSRLAMLDARWMGIEQ